jgi:hypothetical protein
MNQRVRDIAGGILLAVLILVGMGMLFSEAPRCGLPFLLLVVLIYGFGGYALIRLSIRFWQWLRGQ